MIYLYIIFISYMVVVAIYIGSATRKMRGEPKKIKIWAGVLYLMLAVLAYLLNTIDGKLVAGEHFAWIFLGLVLCFLGDLMMMKKEEGDIVPMNAVIAFLTAHIVFLVYFTLYIQQTAGYWVNTRELIIFGVGVVFSILLISSKKLDFKKRRIFILFYTIIGFAMVAKASSLIEFMNTSVSWPTFIGVLFFAVADILSRIHHYGKRHAPFTKGMALMLYYAAMAILPLGIYYV